MSNSQYITLDIDDNKPTISRCVKFDIIVGVSHILVSVLFISLPFAITSLILAYKTNTECFGSYNEFSFDYKLWLIVYGWTNISTTAFAISMMVCAYCGNTMLFGDVIIWFNQIFQFAWYIIGAVLYFITIVPGCEDNNSTIYQFGLVIFIVNSIIWLSMFCINIAK